MSKYTENFPKLSTYNFDTIMCQLKQVCGADPGGLINAQFLSRPTTAKDIAQLFYCTKYIMDVSINLQNQYVELYNFVKDFFTNLDLQEEVNNWLDNALESGELVQIFKQKETTIYSDYINVIDLGVKNDGSDISNELQQILNTHKNLFFPTGVYSFKNVQLDKNVKIKGFNCIFNPIKIDENSNNLYPMFIANSFNEIEIKDINIESEIIADNTNSVTQSSIFEFTNGTRVLFKNVSFKNISNRNQNIKDFFEERKGSCVTIKDTNFIIIDSCKYFNIDGNEVNYVCPYNNDRESVNIIFSNNYAENVNSSLLDFLGNKCEIYNNEYNFNYAGSLLNIFGLYVYIHDEVVLSDAVSVYDCTEDGFFSSNIINIRNVYIDSNIQNVGIYAFCDQINIENYIHKNGDRSLQIYNTTNSNKISKFQETETKTKISVNVSNSYTNSNNFIRSANSIENFYINIENCDLNTKKQNFYTRDAVLKINKSILYNFNGGQSSKPYCIESVSDHIIKMLFITNCNIIPINSQQQENLLIGNVTNGICVGNIKEGIESTLGNNLIGSNNIGYTS